jgi:hypothetical protein
MVHLDCGGWFVVLLREEIRTHNPFCRLDHHQYPPKLPFTELADGKARVSEENVKSDIECIIFPII